MIYRKSVQVYNEIRKITRSNIITSNFVAIQLALEFLRLDALLITEFMNKF